MCLLWLQQVTRLREDVLGNRKRRDAMGDKGGKKDKEKGQKQDTEKQPKRKP
jgi:hypothetical protein